MRYSYLMVLSLLSVMFIAGCVAQDPNEGLPFKECGSSEGCISTAIFECERATSDLGDVKVTVRGLRSAETSLGTMDLCEVNFKYSDSEKTCALPSQILINKYGVGSYERMDKYCIEGDRLK